MSGGEDHRRDSLARVPAVPPAPAKPKPKPRGLTVGDPPPKRPAITLPESEAEAEGEPAGKPLPPAPEPGERPDRRRRRPAKAKPAPAADDDAGSAEEYGTLKGKLRYVSTSLPRALSERLDKAAAGRTLGDVLIGAIRAHHKAIAAELAPPEPDPDDPFPPTPPRIFYREQGGSIRRDIGVQPTEAVTIWRLAHDIGITPAAFMRMALERALPAPD